MFTGIIEELGRVRSIEKRGEGVRIVVEARDGDDGTHEGDSIAVNGVCLTAIDVRADSFAADGSRETLSVRRSGVCVPDQPSIWSAPSRLRRAWAAISCRVTWTRAGNISQREEHGGSWTVRIAYPQELARYLVFKGSVAVEGISLTVAAL